jgi:hypothetical protein
VSPKATVSSDGQSVVATTSAYELVKVPLSGAAGATGLGPVADWFSAGLTNFQRGDARLSAAPLVVWKRPVAGGEWRPVTAIDPKSGERGFVGSVASPAGLFLLSVATGGGTRVAALELDGTRRWLEGLTGLVRAVVLPDRVLVQQEGRLVLAQLDPGWRHVVAERAIDLGAPDTAGIAVGGDTAAYFATQKGQGRRLVWADRDGRASPIPAEAGEYRPPRLSPDGRTVAVYGATATENFGILTIDLQTGRRIHVPAAEFAGNPMCDARGRALLFSAGAGLPQQFFRWDASGNAMPEPAFTTPFRSSASSWLSTGEALLEALNPSLDVVAVDPQGRARPILHGPRAERIPMVSADERWLAYQSNENGRFEIYVQPWPAVNHKYPISTAGGTEPVWSRDGRALYFRHGRSIMMSRVTTTPEFRAEPPVVLFDAGRFAADPVGDPSFDVDPQGRFLMIEDDPDARMELRVVLHAFGASRAGTR